MQKQIQAQYENEKRLRLLGIVQHYTAAWIGGYFRHRSDLKGRLDYLWTGRGAVHALPLWEQPCGLPSLSRYENPTAQPPARGNDE